MRILHIITSVNPDRGGVIEGLKQLGMALQKLGHIVEIASLDDPKAPWLNTLALPHYPLGPVVFNSKAIHYYYSPRLKPWLRANAKNYDAIIINGIWQYHSIATRSVLRKLNMPYFIFPHGMLDPWFRRAYPVKHLLKWLYWLLADYKVLRDARCVLFTCEEERIQSRRSFSPYRCREKVVSLGTSIPQTDPARQREAFMREFPGLRGQRLVLFISRIHPKKGCDLLIEAFARVASRDASLHLVMAGPYQADLREKLDKLSTAAGIADRITWTGMLSGDVKWGAYRSAEVFVLPSHQENFGFVVVEAMACGVPVLISDKVNIWREIAADGAGLVAHDTVDGTTDLLEKWLGMTDREKDEMRQKTIQCYNRHFEANIAATKLIGALSQTSAE